jgi:hypothetical protein
MLRRNDHTPPKKVFSHADGCKILAADPTVSIPWNEIRTGHWEARCLCGVEGVDVRTADDRVRLDPLDPKTSRHAPQCEHRDTSDPALLRVLLKVRDGSGGDYWWVECGTCSTAWQVPHYGSPVDGP